MIGTSLTSPRRSHLCVVLSLCGTEPRPAEMQEDRSLTETPSEILWRSPRNASTCPRVSAGAGFWPNIAAAARGQMLPPPSRRQKEKAPRPSPSTRAPQRSHIELLCSIKDLLTLTRKFPFQLALPGGLAKASRQLTGHTCKHGSPLALAGWGLGACRTPLSLLDNSIQENPEFLAELALICQAVCIAIKPHR